jgi:hypothetical protein
MTRKITVTHFRDERSTTPESVQELTLVELCRVLRARDIRARKSGPAVGLYKLRDGTTRANDNVKYISALAVDIDAGATAEQIISRLPGVAAVLHSTHNHNPAKGVHKLRLVIPLSRNITPEEYMLVWNYANDLVGGVGDIAAAKVSQPAYLPSCPPDTADQAEFEVLEGAPLDVDAILAEAAARAPFAPGTDLAIGYSLPEVIPQGGRNDELLKYAGHCRGRGLPEDAIEALVKVANNDRCKPPLPEAEIDSLVQRYRMDASGDGGEVNDDWPDPEHISESLPPVASFSDHMVPRMLARLVRDISERMCCPPEFPAVALLVAAGSVIGAQVCVRPHEKGTWLEAANVWGLLVAPPSSIKSPPVNEVLATVRELDKQAAKEYEKAWRAYEINQWNHDAQVKKLARTDPDAAAALVPPERPKQTRYIVNDSTYEKLIEISADNPTGFLVYRDEAAGWFHSLNKENQKEARGLYLQGANGLSGYATDRIGRGHTRADNVCLGLLGTIQPGVLANVIYGAVSGGQGDDGLTQRFGLAVYPDRPPKWEKPDRFPDAEASAAWGDAIARLASLDLVAIGAQIMPTGQPYLLFNEDAQAVHDLWRDKLEARLREDDDHPAILAHWGKYRSLVPKLSLILHLLDGGTGPITKRAVARAILWVDLLDSHARRIYHTATNRALTSASALAKKIKSGGLKDGFTRSDVLTREWSGLRTADEVTNALNILRDMGWIRITEDRSGGGRPATRCSINPKVQQHG